MERDHRRLAAIVAADVTGYSRLMGRDESGTLAALKRHRRELFDPKIAEYGGRIVKSTGDGLLLEFPSVVDAVRCAVDVQRGMAERNAGVPQDRRITFRIGINVGDIIIDDDDIFGDGVNVAARLEGLAEPGGICVSRAVRDQVLDKLSFAFDDLGPREVKNIARPVEVFRVALGAQGTAAAAVAPKKAPPARARRPLAALALVVLLSIVGAGAFVAFRHFGAPSAVVPYSAQDRRMTFAVLPIDVPAGDTDAAQVATAIGEQVVARQEANTKWALVVSRPAVRQALAQHTSLHDVGKALDVHFLLRGNVSRAAGGYAVDLFVVDAATERVLDTRSLSLKSATPTARNAEDLENILGWLTYQALRVEVERARSKPDAALDVRDLAFRAYVEWESHPEQDPKSKYTTATQLLRRALSLAPDDGLALYLMARVNLCDCVNGWSTNVAEQQAIGAAALDQYLQRNPNDSGAQTLKANLYTLRGQFEQSLLIVDDVLRREPNYVEALDAKADDLLKLGKPREALTAVERSLELLDNPDNDALAAACFYQLGEYERAAERAQKAVAEMRPQDLRNRKRGAVTLTWVAAEARLGHRSRAANALASFQEAVPNVASVAAIKAWMHPTAYLAGYDPLFEGLRLAGVKDE